MQLLAVATYFPLFSAFTRLVYAADSFLGPPIQGRSDGSTSDNAQLVLEHSPVRNTDCRLAVCFMLALCRCHADSLHLRLATWANRSDPLRLRDHRERQ